MGFFRTISSERKRNNRPEQLIINSGSCKTSLKKNGAGKSVTADSIRYVIKSKKKKKKKTIFEGFTRVKNSVDVKFNISLSAKGEMWGFPDSRLNKHHI